MKRYLNIITAVFLVINAQTFLFAAESAQKNSAQAFEQFLPTNNLKDFKDKLSDDSFISLEKILLSPTEQAYNELMKLDPKKDKSLSFKENLQKAYKRAQVDAAYAKILPDVLHRIYLGVVANPSSSADFNLTLQEIKVEMAEYSDKIINMLKKDINFIRENKKDSSFAKTFNQLLEKDINLINQYRKAIRNNHDYNGQDIEMKINIKPSETWTNNVWHQEFLIKLAALRYIEANLRYSKSSFKYELARFDIISLFTKSKKNTTINFLVNVFVLPENSYKIIPLNPGYLAEREQNFITSLEEIAKKKQNSSYDFITKKNTSQKRSQDYKKPEPSPYESPYGSGSVR